MPNFNIVIIMGNLTRDPELRHLPSNIPVCGFGLAVNRKWKDKEGGDKEEVLFVDCEAFGKTAEVVNQYCKKGSPIHVQGRLKLDQWKDKEGQNRSKIKIVVDQVQFLGGREDAGPAPAAKPAARPAARPVEEPALNTDDAPF